MVFLTNAEESRELARAEIGLFLDDPRFAPWREATLGQPVLVMTVHREPSYWNVPVLIRGRAAGFVRVLGTGKVAALGTLYQDPAQIDACPVTITGIDAAEACRRAQKLIHPEEGETASDPVFVHDGPPGREAWLIEVIKEDRPCRWIFVTPAFVYERPAGELLDEALE